MTSTDSRTHREGIEAEWAPDRRPLFRWSFGSVRDWPSTAAGVVVTYFVVVGLAVSPALYWGASQLSIDVFRSPDETTAYIVGTTFAEQGRLYLQDSITETVTETPSGPRGFIQHDGRSVPFYPLGHGFLLGLFYAVFGRLAPLVLAAIPAALFLSLVLALRAIRPAAPPYTGLALLGVVPLWFFASRVHIDVASALAFVGIAFLCLVYAVQRRSLWWFAFSSASLGLAALMRHQEAVFLFLLGMTFLITFARSTGYSRQSISRALLAYGGAQVCAFVLPLLVLNWLTYGSPLTVGYLLFYREMFPDRVPAEDAGLLSRAWGIATTAIVPGPVDFEVMYKSLWYRLVLLIPVPIALATVALVRNRTTLHRLLGWEGICLLALAMGYVVVSRAAPGTFMAVPDQVTFAGSVVRYWLPLYLLIGLGAAYALPQMSRDVALALIVLMLVYSAYHVWLSDPNQSVLSAQDGIVGPAERYETFILEHTEPDALVFAGGFTDKYIVRARRTAGIQTGSEVPLAETMRRVGENANSISRAGVPVYFLLGSDEEIAALEAQLRQHGKAVEAVARVPWDNRWILLELGPPTQEIVPTGSGAEVTVPGDRIVIEVKHDGSAVNLIANPSFEHGLDGWSGPDVGDRVQRSSQHALFGEYALAMVATGATEEIRRTWHVDLDERVRQSGVWSARAWVLLTEADGVDVVVRAWVKSPDGTTLARHSTRHSEPGTSFVPVVMEGHSLPAGAARLELQIALSPGEDAEAVGAAAFWGGVELMPFARLPAEYCDGDHHGCTWAGAPHASVSQRDSSIDSLVLGFAGGQSLEVPGPFVQGDRLLVDREGVSVARNGEFTPIIDRPLTLRPGDPLTIRAESLSAPVLSVSEE